MGRLIVVIVMFFFISCKDKKKWHLNHSQGEAFGTTFSIKFIDGQELEHMGSYDSLITVINNSMSTYQNDSDISRINKGDTTATIDEHFRKVFLTSKKIYKETKGAFDPTIGILVNAWDFGPEGKIVS